MRVCLFEDQGVSDLQPLTLTRPAFELLCGLTSLGKKQCGYFAPSSVGALIRPYLIDLFRLQQPHIHVNDSAWLCKESTLLVNGRWLPPSGSAPALSSACVALCGEEVAYALVPAELLVRCSPESIDDCLEMWRHKLPKRVADGTLIRYAAIFSTSWSASSMTAKT